MSNDTITKQQFLQAVRNILVKNTEEPAVMAEVAANNRATASQFRAFDPTLADIVDRIASHQEALGVGFTELTTYAEDKLEK